MAARNALISEEQTKPQASLTTRERILLWALALATFALFTYLLILAPRSVAYNSGWLILAWVTAVATLTSRVTARLWNRKPAKEIVRHFSALGWLALMACFPIWNLVFGHNLVASYFLTLAPVTLPHGLIGLLHSIKGSGEAKTDFAAVNLGYYTRTMPLIICGIALVNLSIFYSQSSTGTHIFLLCLAASSGASAWMKR